LLRLHLGIGRQQSLSLIILHPRLYHEQFQVQIRCLVGTRHERRVVPWNATERQFHMQSHPEGMRFHISGNMSQFHTALAGQWLAESHHRRHNTGVAPSDALEAANEDDA
jgi:hypothetical protein